MISVRDIRIAQYINAIARARMALGGTMSEKSQPSIADELAYTKSLLESVAADLERYREVNAELEEELKREQEENAALRAQVYEAGLKAVADVVDKHKDDAA